MIFIKKIWRKIRQQDLIDDLRRQLIINSQSQLDTRIIEIKKKMIDFGIKPKDLKGYFGWSWTYTSDILRGKADVSDDQINKIEAALPDIQKNKLEEVAA